MLKWLSQHRRCSSSASGAGKSLYRVSLDLNSDCSASSQPSTSRGSAAPALSRPSNLPRGKGLSSLRRRSLPAIHLQEMDNSAAMMSNPPVFSNPLRRRGCCDHQHSEQMQQYRIDAIMREEAAHQASFLVPQEAN